MAETLSPYRLGKARGLYNIFNVFNALSWQFLAGNIITLFAMRLGASSTYIGILNALMYASFFFLPMGKILTKRFSMVKIFSAAWIGRALGMLPLLFAPFLFLAGYQNSALLLTLLGVSLFHIFRGVGTIGNNPVLSYLSPGPDRGSYMTQVQIINSAVGMFAGFIIAMILGRDPPLFLYIAILSVGIISGIFSGVFMAKIPGPDLESGEENKKLGETIKEAMSQPALREFLIILLLVSLVSGVSRNFLVVYSREVFSQTDGMVALYAVFGGMGNLIVGMFIKFLVDRIGAKPLFIVCVIISLVSMAPIPFFPTLLDDNVSTVILFLCFLFFIMNFGWLGAEGIMQTYYLGLVPPKKMMDMGILYFFGYGLAGAVGSFLGGLFLDTVTAISGSSAISYKSLYSILVLITIFILFFMRKLVSLGALPLRGALEVMFSFRDLRAITLLDKLNKISDSGEEKAILEALVETPSKLSLKGLLNRVRSPRFSVRVESIRAIDALETLSEEAEKALIDDLINNPYTTAYKSARALGNHGVFSAVGILRELAVSNDYMLAGEAFIALAKLNDDAFRPQIEQMITDTKNPRLRIMGVEALGIYRSPLSLAVLLDTIRGKDPPPYLRDAVVLAMASILDLQNKYYSLLVRFLDDRSLAVALAMDEAESACEHFTSIHGHRHGKNDGLAACSRQVKVFQHAVSEFIKNSKGAEISRWIQDLPDDLVNGVAQSVLSEAALDDELVKLRRLRLLIVSWAAQELRHWTNKLKK